MILEIFAFNNVSFDEWREKKKDQYITVLVNNFFECSSFFMNHGMKCDTMNMNHKLEYIHGDNVMVSGNNLMNMNNIPYVYIVHFACCRLFFVPFV